MLWHSETCDLIFFCRRMHSVAISKTLVLGGRQKKQLRVVNPVALAALAATSLAQECYYPSGKASPPQKTHTAAASDNDFPAEAARVARWQKTNTEWLYCCVGSDYGNNYSSACADGRNPFTIASAALIYRVAALSTAEVISSTATQATASGTSASGSETCPDSGAQITAAVGAGVGVPLVVVSLSAIGWALWGAPKGTQGRRSPGRLLSQTWPWSNWESSACRLLETHGLLRPKTQYANPCGVLIRAWPHRCQG
jgi:hypothetical protein